MPPEHTKESASKRALSILRGRIQDRTYVARSRLPSEIELAEEFSVSRGALREALRALELMGLLESRHGSGTFVTGLTPSDLFHSLGNDLIIDSTSAVELVEFREAVEPSVSALAAKNATPEQLLEIRALHAAQGETTDAREYMTLDSAMHSAIAAASGNSVLSSLLESITYGPAWKRMWELLRAAPIPDRSRQDHEMLVRAIEAGDAELAAAISRVHLANARRRLVKSIEERELTNGEL